MDINEEDVGNYVVIPDHVLASSAESMRLQGESNNSFQRMIDLAEQYRQAELTPIVVYDPVDNALYCIVKELYGKKLN